MRLTSLILSLVILTAISSTVWGDTVVWSYGDLVAPDAAQHWSLGEVYPYPATFTAALTAESAGATPALTVQRNISTSPQGQSAGATPSITVIHALTVVIIGQSTTGQPVLGVALYLAVQVQAVSSGSSVNLLLAAVIPASGRLLAVPAESRTLTRNPETRYLQTPAESRILNVGK